MKQTAVILGARGSVPVSGEKFIRYGGTTTCVFLRLAGQPLVLDAGTRMLNLSHMLGEGEREIPLLLTHPHVDHLLGLPMCPAVLDLSYQCAVYGVPRGGMDMQTQLSRLMSRPCGR